MTRYEEMWKSENVERAMKRYHTDKEKLDADSVNFQPIDDMDIGERYLVSYYMPTILPISEILWIRSINGLGKKFMWALISDGYCQLLLVEDESNFDTIVKMLCQRNDKLIYGENKDLYDLTSNNFEQFCKLISLHPNEDAANIKVDPALLPVTDDEEPEIQKGTVTVAEELETSYIPPKEQDLGNAVVPENALFAEEMKLLIRLAKKYPDSVHLTLYEPVSASDMIEFESRNSIKLTDELKALFLFTNGFDLSAANIDINSLELTERYLSAEWEWGDTKRYVYIGDRIGDGEVILLDRESGNIITNNHGEEIDWYDLTTLLSDAICEFLGGDIEDEELDNYISETESCE